MDAPTFDPEAPFEDVGAMAAAAPTFDPGKPFEEVRGPSFGSVAKQVGIGAGEGLLGTPDFLGKAMSQAPGMGPLLGLGVRGGQKLFNKAIDTAIGPAEEGDLHHGDDTYSGGIKRVLGTSNLDPDQYPAQNLPERIGRTTGEFLGSPLTYMGPGSLAGKVATAIPSAVTSELAGHATEGKWYEPIARLAGAAAVPTAASGARRLLSPPAVPAERAAARDALRGEGIEVTAGQLTGNEGLRSKEATSGAPAQRVNERQQRQLTRAAIRSIGEDGDNVHDAIAVARPRIGQEIEDATSNIRVRWDPEFQGDIMPIESALLREGYAPTSEVSTRVKALLGDVIGAFDFVPRGKRVNPGPDHMEMSGEALHERVRHSSALSRAVREGGTVGHYAERIRDALYDLADRTANRGGTRENTGDRAAFTRFQNARREWKNLLALEDVISSAGDVAASGRLTPAMVRRLATFSEKSDYGRGRSDFAELARNANMIMKPYPDSGTSGRFSSQLMSRGLGALAGSIIGGGGAGPWGSGAGATIGAIVGPQIQGRAMMSRPMQRYLSRGAFAPRSPYEHLVRTGRAAAPTLDGFADGGDVPDNPYATDAISNALDTGAQIADAVSPQNPYSSLPPESQARQDEAFNTSVDRLKQLGKDVFFAPNEFLKAPPWEQAAGMIGGIKAPRWTPVQDSALARWAKTGEVPEELAGRSEAALRTRAQSQGLIEPAEKYRRQPVAKLPTTPGPYSHWTPAEDEMLAKYMKSDELTVPDSLSHRSEYAMQQRARKMGLLEPSEGGARVDVSKKFAGPPPDFLDLAAEPRAAVLFFQRAADSGNLQAKAIMNQIAGATPSKRDKVLQYYIERLKKADWKPGMARGGGVRNNPYTRAA